MELTIAAARHMQPYPAGSVNEPRPIVAAGQVTYITGMGPSVGGPATP